MVRPDCKTSFFQIGAQKWDGPYNCKASPVDFGQLLFFVAKSLKPVANGPVSVFFFFLLKYKRDLLVAGVSIECVLLFCS